MHTRALGMHSTNDSIPRLRNSFSSSERVNGSVCETANRAMCSSECVVTHTTQVAAVGPSGSANTHQIDITADCKRVPVSDPERPGETEKRDQGRCGMLPKREIHAGCKRAKRLQLQKQNKAQSSQKVLNKAVARFAPLRWAKSRSKLFVFARSILFVARARAVGARRTHKSPEFLRAIYTRRN
jgi:hypothetical protein